MLNKIICTVLISIALIGLAGMNYSYAATPSSGNMVEKTTPNDLNSDQFMFDLGSVTHADIKEQNWVRKGINFIFERVITIMAATIGGAAVLMMTIGGFMILASAGRQEMYDKGKNYIFKAVIGIVFVLGAYILVTTIQLLVKSVFTG